MAASIKFQRSHQQIILKINDGKSMIHFFTLFVLVLHQFYINSIRPNTDCKMQLREKEKEKDREREGELGDLVKAYY